MFYAQPEADRIQAGLFTPQFAGTESVLLTAGILGATVMPHVIYLHSALTQHRVVGRTDDERRSSASSS
jgi:manganese transport protein